MSKFPTSEVNSIMGEEIEDSSPKSVIQDYS